VATDTDLNRRLIEASCEAKRQGDAFNRQVVGKFEAKVSENKKFDPGSKTGV
jgi:hypothetical protein